MFARLTLKYTLIPNFYWLHTVLDYSQFLTSHSSWSRCIKLVFSKHSINQIRHFANTFGTRNFHIPHVQSSVHFNKSLNSRRTFHARNSQVQKYNYDLHLWHNYQQKCNRSHVEILAKLDGYQDCEQKSFTKFRLINPKYHIL